MFQRVGLYFKYLEVNAISLLDFLWSLTFLGVPPAGIALLDAQGYAAVLTVEASDEPHGVLNFALSSRFVLLQEANITIQLFINREFGSLGLCSSRMNGVFRQVLFKYSACVDESHCYNKSKTGKNLKFINSGQDFITSFFFFKFP